MKNQKYVCEKGDHKFSDKDLLDLNICAGLCPFDGTELDDIKKAS